MYRYIYIYVYIYIWNMRNILECFIVYCFWYVLQTVLFYRGITVYIWNVEYSGMFYVLFHFCFHVLHNVPFYRGKTGHSNGKSLANHHWKNIILQMYMSACRETPSWKEQNIHRMGSHSLMRHFMPLYIWNMWNTLECFMCFRFMF